MKFYTEIFINSKKSKVWEAFTGTDQFFMAYYGANIVSSFVLGEKIEYSGMYQGKETIHIYGKILEFKDKSLLCYTDHPGPGYRDNHADLVSRVMIKFEERGSSTRICLTNDQFSTNNPMEEEAKQWYLILSNLKTWIETGKLMDINS